MTVRSHKTHSYPLARAGCIQAWVSQLLTAEWVFTRCTSVDRANGQWNVTVNLKLPAGLERQICQWTGEREPVGRSVVRTLQHGPSLCKIWIQPAQSRALRFWAAGFKSSESTTFYFGPGHLGPTLIKNILIRLRPPFQTRTRREVNETWNGTQVRCHYQTLSEIMSPQLHVFRFSLYLVSNWQFEYWFGKHFHW